jgi:hypothetical protein
MPRGGKRANAGRPLKYPKNFRIALVNEYGLLKAKNPLWTSQQILDQLQAEGKIDKKERATITRMLEPRYNRYTTIDGNFNLKELLTTSNRDGILAALPTLEKKN